MSGTLIRFFERRAGAFDWEQQQRRVGGLGGLTESGMVVNPDVAMTMSAVFACVRVLMESVGVLPLITYRRLERGKERATDHPLYGLLHDAPNPDMTSQSFREALTANTSQWGNGFAECVIDNAGRVREMWPLMSKYMDPPKRSKDGTLVYTYRDPRAKGPIQFPSWRILHIMGPSMSGLWGMTPIATQRQAIGLGLTMETFGARLFRNGSKPGVVLKHPGKLSDRAYERLLGSWDEKHGGAENSHRTALLEEGTSIEAIGIPPEDAQFLQSRKFQIEEIARPYRMQLHLIGHLEHATFSNIEHQSLEFVIYTLAPWLVRFEQGILLRLLLPSERATYFSEFLVDSLVRGDITTRYNAYNIGRNGGWLSRNEIRERENMNAINGGDDYLTPLNMQQISAMSDEEKTVALLAAFNSFVHRNEAPEPERNGHHASI
jgi:HK97 family phage portal protein